jgi:alkylhydroperoxidase family enzyme
MQDAVWSAGQEERLELVRRRLAVLLREPDAADRRPDAAPEPAGSRIETLAAWPSSPWFDVADRAGLAAAERFVIDVGGTTDDERRGLAHSLGDAAFSFVQGLYVLDMAHRVEMTAGAVFTPEARPRGMDHLARPVGAADTATATGTGTATATRAAASPGSGDGAPLPGRTGLWARIEHFMREVARLDELDPVTTEIVRLAGARQHTCRVCRSRRSVSAVTALGSGGLLDDVERGVPARLDAAQQAAVELTEAMVTQPSTIDAPLVAALRRRFTPGQVVEIIWDVARNGANKIAVFFGADEPTVDGDVEYFDLSADGDVLYGLDAPLT